jgi:hypothetical protein
MTGGASSVNGRAYFVLSFGTMRLDGPMPRYIPFGTEGGGSVAGYTSRFVYSLLPSYLYISIFFIYAVKIIRYAKFINFNFFV